MKYVSKIYALNICCDLKTCGDWHCSALNWEKVKLKESENSIWGEYGIEQNKKIPDHNGTYNVANHIRALLDMIEDLDFSNAQGMREDFICCEEYTKEIFEKVSMLFERPDWKMIDRFIGPYANYRHKVLAFSSPDLFDRMYESGRLKEHLEDIQLVMESYMNEYTKKVMASDEYKKSH